MEPTLRPWWRRRVRWRHGRPEVNLSRSWRPSPFLAFCCRIGLHFMADDFRRDGSFCECGRESLTHEQLWRA